MDKLSLEARARELARTASEARSGRAADTVFGAGDSAGVGRRQVAHRVRLHEVEPLVRDSREQP